MKYKKINVLKSINKGKNSGRFLLRPIESAYLGLTSKYHYDGYHHSEDQEPGGDLDPTGSTNNTTGFEGEIDNNDPDDFTFDGKMWDGSVLA